MNHVFVFSDGKISIDDNSIEISGEEALGALWKIHRNYGKTKPTKEQIIKFLMDFYLKNKQ